MKKYIIVLMVIVAVGCKKPPDPDPTPNLDFRWALLGDYSLTKNCETIIAGEIQDVTSVKVQVNVSIPVDSAPFDGHLNPPDYVGENDEHLQLSIQADSGVIVDRYVYVNPQGSFKGAVWDPHNSFTGQFSDSTLSISSAVGGLGSGTYCSYK